MNQEITLNYIVYTIPPELLLYIIEFYTYEEIHYIMHNSKALCKYLRNFNILHQKLDKYLPSKYFISYLDTNINIYYHIANKRLFLYMRYNPLNILSFGNLENIIIDIIKYNNAIVANHFFSKIINYIILEINNNNEDENDGYDENDGDDDNEDGDNEDGDDNDGDNEDGDNDGDDDNDTCKTALKF